jgi:hypothetical protein
MTIHDVYYVLKYGTIWIVLVVVVEITELRVATSIGSRDNRQVPLELVGSCKLFLFYF